MTTSVGLLSAWDHAKSVMTLCVLLGVIFYVLDRTVGVRVYRFLYNLCHSVDAQMPEGEQRGFLYNQSSRRMMFLVTLIEVWYIGKLIMTYGVLGLDYLSELFVWFLLPFALPFGYYLVGRYLVYPLISRINPFIHKVDELNRSEIHMDDVKRGVEGVGGRLIGWATGFGARAPSPKPAGPVERVVVATPEPQAPQPSADDILKKFTGRN